MKEYTCSVCGQVHEGYPAIGFGSPYHYYNLSDQEKEEIAELSSDFCTIHHEEQTDRFIRAVLIQKVNDHTDTLQYGVWVSLSEKSFTDYSEHFSSDDYEATYFGYLCSQIPPYENTLSIKADVVYRSGGNRPEVIPHQGQDNDFVLDYYEGITKAEAEQRIHKALGE